jgi:hypothetical protein
MQLDSLEKLCAAYKSLEADGGHYSWSALDRALIAVCATMPLHDNIDEVYAKVRIINRAYLANLQFGAANAEWKVAEAFIKGTPDAVFAPLRSSSQFSLEGLPILLNAHENLIDLAYQVTGKVQNSFVSKYLHFHFPATVPIFDNLAYNAAWNLAQPPYSQSELYDGRRNRDYGYFCGALLRIMHELQTHGVESPRLKLLDVLLYGNRGLHAPDDKEAPRL